MNLKQIHLRALEPEDIDILEKVENDISYWNYSNQTEPLSIHTLKQFIAEQHRDIFEVRQKRFVISDIQKNVLGFIDLFDFEPIHRRAGVGLLILESYRRKGVGKQALILLSSYAQNQLNIKTLFANIAIENAASIQLFQSLDYSKAGHKKDWNFMMVVFMTNIFT
jgi:diamine N-acetyltransferase